MAFDRKEYEKYQAEAQEKWGNTAAYKEYEEKGKHYSQQKHSDLSDGMDRIMAAFALCMKNGEAPDSVGTQELVKTLQIFITENYYLCTKEILAGLGQMYAGDERFRNNIDKHGEGTAAFICQAVEAYCRK